jgi:hypothetical protein
MSGFGSKIFAPAPGAGVAVAGVGVAVAGVGVAVAGVGVAVAGVGVMVLARPGRRTRYGFTTREFSAIIHQ